VCEAASQIYSVAAVAGAASYEWTLPSGWTGSSTTASITTTIGENGGTLSVAAKNACGTGSLKSIDVVVKEKPATPVIVLNTGNVLHSDAAAGNQWLKQKAAIAGAVSQDYSVTANGDYSVIVSLNGCSSDTSNVIKVTVTGLDDLGSDKTIKLYPNPVTNELVIEIEGNREEIKYEIINTAGQIVISGVLIEKEIIQTTNLSKGMYIVKLNNNDILKFEKVLKE